MKSFKLTLEFKEGNLNLKSEQSFDVTEEVLLKGITATVMETARDAVLDITAKHIAAKNA